MQLQLPSSLSSWSGPLRRWRSVCRPRVVAGAVAAALAAVAALPVAATPVTLTFDPASGRGGGLAEWGDGGYALAVDGGDPTVGSGAAVCSPRCPQDGSAYLLVSRGSFGITPTDRSGSFGLTAFDAGQLLRGGADGWAQALEVSGLKSDGSSVTQRFALDIVSRGRDAGGAGFQTFLLGPDFFDLRSVAWSAGGGAGGMYALDNIRLAGPAVDATAVPEPGSIALVAVALLAAAGAGSRRSTKPRPASA